MEEDLAPWTETEIRECLEAGEVFDSRRIDNILNKGGRNPVPTPSTTTPTPPIPTPTPSATTPTPPIPAPTPSTNTNTPEHVNKPEQSGTEKGAKQPSEQQ